MKLATRPLPEIIVQGKVDGALVDQNGIYVTPSTTIAVLRRISEQRDHYKAHAERLAELVRDAREGQIDAKWLARAIAALARWEKQK